MESNYYKKLLVALTLFVSVISFSQNDSPKDSVATAQDSIAPLKYNFKPNQQGTLFLNNPSQVEVRYDESINKFVLVEKVGDYTIGTPIFMTPREYEKYRLKNDIKDYFKEKVSATSKDGNNEARKNLLPKYYVNSKFFESVFGGTEVEVIPSGQVSIKIGGIYQNNENPLVSIENQKSFTFDFDQQISVSMQAKVGTKLNVTANYDTQSTFDFQNLVKLEYAANEDDIIQTLDAGNISFPIKNSLIDGAQALFGIRADFQFGKTTIRTAVSQQNSESKTVVAEGGATIQEFELQASDYDNDRHFFLSQFFRETYDEALANYPLINSPINITRIEVWVTNTNQNVENYRSIVAFADIGETNFFGSTNNVVNVDNITETNPVSVSLGGQIANLPSNDANNISELLIEDGDIRTSSGLTTGLDPYDMEQGRDYSFVQNARQLSTSEYTLNSQLGYISLNRRLNDGEVLAVAYEYTVVGASNGETVFKVGEFSNDGINAPDNIAVKLLRSEITNTVRQDNATVAFPTWRLMMKNVYALGAYPLQQEGFIFELMYRDDEVGVLQNTLQNASDASLKERTLINLFNIDRLDQSQYSVEGGDGFFDYVEGITVNSSNGLIYFTKAEPFGEDLVNSLTNVADQNKYGFEDLYLTTKTQAKNEYQDKDKFFLKGYFRSDSSSGISLGAFNIPQGSVTVTADGRQLVEGVDYVVDYQLGRVQILDPSLEASGTPISATVENNTFFNQQRKSFYGVDVEHQISEDFILGATFLNVNEKPITAKVNYGAEPINNVMLGFNMDYSSEVPLFTKLANKLPFVETDVPSNVSVRADVAYLLPGAPRGIDVNGSSTAYIDDFEGSQIPISLDGASQWFLASTPNTQGFSGDAYNDLSINDNRAKLAWYTIDQLFYGSGSDLPDNIDDDELSRSEVRPISYTELFSEVDLDATQLNLVSTLDLAYYPSERGPYNFNLNSEANLPEENWGGIMRALTTNNFEQANVEYLQFWLMNPYENYSITEEEGLPAGVNHEDPNNQVGKLVINLGNLSEDILRDGEKQYENGLPEDGIKEENINVNLSSWGYTPRNTSILYAFSEIDEERIHQDVGLDGSTDAEEATNLVAYYNEDPENRIPAQIRAQYNELDENEIIEILGEDPAADNFQFFRGSELDDAEATILTRYKNYNNTQGNTPTADQSEESYPTSSTTYPDVEDINKDQTMNAVSSYYEYEVSLNQSDFVVGTNNIVDIKTTQDTNEATGELITTNWYQFRIPIKTGFTADYNISDFNSIRFMRMFLTQFKMPVVLRFAELELVRADWRRYTEVLNPDADDYGEDLDEIELNNFEVGVVNIEENDQTYELPPGIDREELQGTATVISQNEQSATIAVTDLPVGDIRAMYKNISIDMRRYKTLQMYLHAQRTDDQSLANNDLKAIIRLGTDLDDNYYEIEKPLVLSTVLSDPSALQAWPEANNLELNLEELAALKLERESLQESLTEQYIGTTSDGLIIKVKGSPTLAAIKTVLLGVKNDSETQKSGEVWFNELRAVGFDNEGGWAGTISADANFADVADVSLTGSISTVGFGSVESRVQERSLEDSRQYNFTTNVQLGKVLTPANWNIQLPANFTFSEHFIDPKYDYGYQDITVADALENGSGQAKINAENSRDYTRRKGISFVNVKKNRNPNSKRKPKFYDAENLSATFSYSDEYHRDYTIKKYLNQNVLAGLSYNFSFSPFTIEPFKNTKFLKGKMWKFVKDFNFNPVPKVLAVNSKINRNFVEQQSRNLVAGFTQQPILTQRNYLFDWDYTVGFDLTKSLKLNFNATNNHIYDSFGSEEEVDIFDRFIEVGRPNQYHQKLNATYKLPINKLPYLNFITADYAYTADFDWQAASQNVLDSGLTYEEVVGNMIQNANTHNLNANIDFERFYRNLGLNKLFAKKTAKKQAPNKKGLKPKNTKQVSSQKVQLSKNASTGKKILKGVYDVVTSVKKGKISYSQNNGTLMQGYRPSVGFLGRNNFEGGLAPNLGFVFGGQTDILRTAIANDWLVTRATDTTDYYNKSYGKTSAEKLDYNVSIKPLKDFTIDVRGNMVKTNALTQQLDYIEGNNDVEAIEPYETGNYSISYSMLGTVFNDHDELYQKFLSYRGTISERLSEETGLVNQPGQAFQENGQQAMLPAFLAAYGGKDPNTISTGLFRNIPIPNWTVRYNGLMKNKWFKKRFSSFTLSHAYKSSYTLGGFTNNLAYVLDDNNVPEVNISGNYQPKTLLSTATLIDEFSPLVRLDMKMRNSFSFKGEVRSDRSLTLNFNNSTITDVKGIEYVVGLGYKIKDVKFVTKITGKKETVKGDVNLRADISLRDNLTLIRTIDEENDQITGGERLFGFKFLADYNLSKSLTASFYYNHNTFNYAISTSYPRQNINTGFNIIYNLGN